MDAEAMLVFASQHEKVLRESMAKKPRSALQHSVAVDKAAKEGRKLDEQAQEKEELAQIEHLFAAREEKRRQEEEEAERKRQEEEIERKRLEEEAERKRLEEEARLAAEEAERQRLAEEARLAEEKARQEEEERRRQEEALLEAERQRSIFQIPLFIPS